MSLIENELEIINIDLLFEMQLSIPNYQRPYRWVTQSTNRLFLDIFEAFKSNVKEYRLGSIILHKDKNTYNIVDGQQRITTLAILLFVLDEDKMGLLSTNYSKASVNSIISNYELLKIRIMELNDDEKLNFKRYLKENCRVVKIVTDNEQEAFQFFDSQNSRGKELKPHDILKSYHLREMVDDSEVEKLNIISAWEEMDQNYLENLFGYYLFPVIQWYKKKSGLNYSTSMIAIFKGVKQDANYNYALYHKASNIFIEQLNKSGTAELFGSNCLNQYQLTQSIIAGKRFFYWTLHYNQLLVKVKNKIELFHDKKEVPNVGSGDIYVRRLYEITLLFFADRFGLDSIDDSIMKLFYTWVYSIRIKMQAVSLVTINKYAMGKHETINYGKDLLTIIAEITDPVEIKSLILDKVEDINIKDNSDYKIIHDNLMNWNGWK